MLAALALAWHCMRRRATASPRKPKHGAVDSTRASGVHGVQKSDKATSDPPASALASPPFSRTPIPGWSELILESRRFYLESNTCTTSGITMSSLGAPDQMRGAGLDDQAERVAALQRESFCCNPRASSYYGHI